MFKIFVGKDFVLPTDGKYRIFLFTRSILYQKYYVFDDRKQKWVRT